MPKTVPNDGNSYHKKMSESITLRFDKLILDELREESELKMESINTLLNQIVKSYIKWHKPSAIAGLIYINKFLYRDIVEQLSNESLNQIVDNYAQHHFMDTIEIFHGKSSVSIYLDYLLTWLKISGFHYRVDENEENYITIKIQIDLGLKFSRYISTKIKTILETLKQPKVDVKFTEHIVVVRIPS
ncbi:MAG: hypothetical protein AB7V56_01595 [Candidatus Nitrosocosmicus sp.]|jgi:hypothetical protein|uniref:hypothetical protein n=1 Tax=Candidatus Nitrosocosmicus agrestis TaxID=2563600 RepID=UPI00122E5F7B|nr:hypothetical protein [Candidatus Nitrosocosmicus sp. SS]KAA2282016.1 hypothetical protein F1Z66_07640 [Candidatus Nitrosocosmicus sp. SS]KAF0869921.1 hypothetical protein E5N71_02915 [Candidatus Nitrosocosmicus sp. SS]MDR4490720.1 hypothetical protein [Candidatus Nitrosocosmicus sp.]